ncbi:MAG: Pr6Pr family membrane protein [Bacteroidetes bacterium]|nr:Pr6Pr family membrane protein [Bacteroidota bacterium]
MKNRMAAATIAGFGWSVIILQYCLFKKQSNSPVLDLTIRFLTYFPISTGIFVASYFSIHAFSKKLRAYEALTALTIFIVLSTLISPLQLRYSEDPSGLQTAAAMLYSAFPLLTLAYWYTFTNKFSISYRYTLKWLAYPAIYLQCILIGGRYTGFYPYSFVDISNISLATVLIYSSLLLIGTGILILLLIFSARLISALRF